MAIEIVDLPIKNGGSFHSYVNVETRPGTMGFTPSKAMTGGHGWPWSWDGFGALIPLGEVPGNHGEPDAPGSEALAGFVFQRFLWSDGVATGTWHWWHCQEKVEDVEVLMQLGIRCRIRCRRFFRTFCSDVRNFCRAWPAWKELMPGSQTGHELLRPLGERSNWHLLKCGSDPKSTLNSDFCTLYFSYL